MGSTIPKQVCGGTNNGNKDPAKGHLIQKLSKGTNHRTWVVLEGCHLGHIQDLLVKDATSLWIHVLPKFLEVFPNALVWVVDEPRICQCGRGSLHLDVLAGNQGVEKVISSSKSPRWPAKVGVVVEVIKGVDPTNSCLFAGGGSHTLHALKNSTGFKVLNDELILAVDRITCFKGLHAHFKRLKYRLCHSSIPSKGCLVRNLITRCKPL